MTRLQIIGLLNLEGIHASLDYMPPCTYRDYCRWILAQSDLAQNWAQLVGMTGLTRLTFGLLDGLLTEAELDALLPYTVPINVFNMYEVMADNLAIGLACRTELDRTYDTRRHMVRAMNNAVIARLRGATLKEAQGLIAGHAAFDEISAFKQSLSADKHYSFASTFCEQHPDADLKAIEYSIYPNLVANVEACHQVVATLKGYLTQELVQKGFVRRFAGLNRLLDDTYISRDYLLQIGGNTIMVRPLLGYYIGVIAEEIRLISNYEAVVENGLLLKALEDASVLARLLNDLGPHLLEQSDNDHLDLSNKLRQVQDQQGFSSFHDLLLHVTERADSTLTRLKKDVKFGEFNLCLYEPYRSNSIPEAINAFYEQLCFLSDVYKERWGHLHELLSIINFETQSTLISDIILRFIGFHDQMYRAPSDNPEGEYAV